MSDQRTLLIFGALPPARTGTADYLEEQMQDLRFKKIKTQMFNGYEEEVAGLYEGMDLIKHH